MKTTIKIATIVAAGLLCFKASAQTIDPGKAPANNLFIDVHHFGAGKVKLADVAKAHQKDLGTENKYGVHFLKYWVSEAEGNVYCLSSAADSNAIRRTHAEAHGMLPDQIYLVTSGEEAKLKPGNKFFLDVHNLGAGKVKAADVVGVHKKDLAVQDKYGVNLLNYWVNEKNGKVFCLSQAPDSSAVINTHKEAHGLLPAKIEEVKSGN